MDQRNIDFVCLLKQYDRRVATYVFSLIPDWNDAEDVLQDTWVRLWEQFDEYRCGEDFGVWACTMARYLVMTYRKRTHRKKLHFSSDVVDALAAEVTASPDASEQRLSAMADCVRQLNDSARDLLRLCYSKGAKIKDVAVQLSRSVNGTYLMLSRIRRELHDCIEAVVTREDNND